MSRWGNLLVVVSLAVCHSALAQIRDPHDPNNPIAPYAQPSLQIKNMTQDTDHVKETKIGEYEFDPTQTAQAWGNCLDADVWVLVDYSDSMSGFEPFIAEALKEIAAGLLFEPSFRRMGFIAFDYTPTLTFDLTSDYKKAMVKILEFQKTEAMGGTDINKGLAEVKKYQDKAKPNSNAKSNEFKKILILISDGEDLSEVDKIISTAKEMKNNGWWIYSIMASRYSPEDKKDEASESHTNKFKLLKAISGNPTDGESYYVDTILLQDLPQHFREKFSCM